MCLREFWIEPILEKSESRFRKGRSVEDHTDTVSKNQIINKVLKMEKKAYFAHVDLEMVLDRVPKNNV